MKVLKTIGKILRKFTGGLTAILAVLCVIAVLAGDIASVVFSQSLDMFLGQKSYEVNNTSEDVQYYESEFDSSEELSKAGQDLCQEVEEEGIVLLKNDNNVLPLDKKSKISVFGQDSVDLVYGGVGAGSVDASTAPSLKEAFENYGFVVNETLWDFYDTGAASTYRKATPSVTGAGSFDVNEVPMDVYTDDVKNSISDYSDAAVVVLGRSGGESADISTDYLELSQEEQDLLKYVTNSFDKVVVVLNTNNAIETGFLNDYDIDACIWTGALGQTGVNAIPEVLNGTVNPSGSLVDTYAYDNFSAPAMANFGDYTITNSDVTNGTKYMVYAEGIYVGYRYYETRYEDVVLGNETVDNYDYTTQVAFPFGYGMSYTDFAWSNYTVNETEDTFEISVDVTNTGDVAGKDTVQIYMQSPFTDYDKENAIEKSSVELVGFEKTDMIEAGKTETVTISVDKESMKAYDEKGEGTYIVDAGDYYFAAGVNAHDALNNILSSKEMTTANGMDYDGNNTLVYTYNQAEFDATTYAKSTATNTDIENQFTDGNIQTYDSDFTYLSRSDWEGTWPTTYADGSWKAPQEIIDGLEISYTEDKDATTPTYETISDEYGELSLADMIGLDMDDPKWEALLDQMSWEETYNLVRKGGYLTNSVPSVNAPGTIDKDGPSGISTTLTGGNISCMAYQAEEVMASTWNVELIERVGELVGEDGINAGVTVWYAPAMDIHRAAFSGRNFEYYSEDGFLSGKMGAAESQGAVNKGLIVTIKHFALNDEETNRMGVSVFANEQSIRELYLEAFELPVTEGNANGVMTSMNRIGTRWTGGHTGLITNVLKGEWGFEGLIVTDQTSFPNFAYSDILEGLEAGTNLWLNVANNMWKLSDEQITPTVQTMFREAAHEVLFATANSNAMNTMTTDSTVTLKTPVWKFWRVGFSVIGLAFAYFWYWLTKKIWKVRPRKIRKAEKEEKKAAKRAAKEAKKQQ